MKLGAALQHGALREKLAKNRRARKTITTRHTAARAELLELLKQARRLDPPLTVDELRKLTGVSRRRIYELLNGRTYKQGGTK